MRFDASLPRAKRRAHLYFLFTSHPHSPSHVILYPSPVIQYPSPVILYPSPVILYPSPVILYPSPVILYLSPVILYLSPVILYLSPVILYPSPVIASKAKQDRELCCISSLFLISNTSSLYLNPPFS